MPLEAGRNYSIMRYFKTGYNPIHVRVTGVERRQLYDGSTVPCLALQVTSRGSTITAYLTNDQRRLPVELTLPLPYGSVTLELRQADGGRRTADS
jgi:hypothetical protein